MQLTQGLRRAAQLFPRRTSTIFGKRRRTWSETLERVRRLAACMAALGVGPGDRVAIIALNSDRYIEALFAAYWAGAVTALCNTRWAPAEHAQALGDSQPSLIFVDEAHAKMARELPGFDPARTILMADHAAEGMIAFEALIAEHAPIEERLRGGTDLACLLYTGGTTGWPKGVMLSQDNISLSCLTLSAMVPNEYETVVLQVAPMFHGGGYLNVVGYTMFGATHVIHPGFDAGRVANAIVAEKINTLVLVPTMIDMLDRHLQANPVDVGTVRRLKYGASPISDSLLRRAMRSLPNAKFSQSYGQTESSGAIAVLEAEFHHADGEKSRLLRSAGRPNPLVDIRIVDPDMNERPRGEVGEVVARGPMVMLGYWNKPELTAETIVDGWLHTGDAGYMDENGFLFLVDRYKDMIVSGGENVFSGEVENALARHPAILECAVIPVPDPKWGERVHAVVRLREGASVDEEELTRHCQSLIGGFKRPRSYTFRTEPLPLSGAGKVLKSELRKPFWEGRDRHVG